MPPHDLTPKQSDCDTPQQRSLARGSHVRIGGQTVSIVNWDRTPEGRLEAVLDTGDGLRRMRSDQLWAAISPPGPQPLEQEQDEPLSPVLAELEPAERFRLTERYADLLQIETGSRRGDLERDRTDGRLDPRFDPSTTTLTERITEKARELKGRGEKGASPAQLRRQLRSARLHGIEGLVHGNRVLPGDRLRNVDPAVVETIGEALADELRRPKISNRAKAVQARAALIAAGQSDTVTDYEVKLVIGELSRGRSLHLPSKGRERASSKPKVAYGMLRVSRPGEYVQVDATPSTIHVFDPRIGWIPAIILTAIDLWTRCVVALRVVTNAATSRDVAMLIWDIGRPHVTRMGYPYELIHHLGVPRLVSINHDPQDPDGSRPDLIGTKASFEPSAIVMDHGRDFDSRHLISALARLGIDVIFCPPRTPHAKGVVEALHNTIREIESLFPGHKGSCVENRPAHAEDYATLTAQDLRDLLWERILEDYHHREHTGLTRTLGAGTKMTPFGALSAYLEAGGSLNTPRDPYRYLELLSPEYRLVQPYGVTIETRVYDSADLQALRPLLGKGLGAAARPLLVRYDRWDVSRVYAQHPLTRQWLCIPRAGTDSWSRQPCSELLDRAIRRQLISGEHRPLSTSERNLQDAEAVLRWRSNALLERNQERILAIESGRAWDYAHDLGDLPPEVKKLAFDTTDETIVGELVDTTADSDEILDADLIDPDDDEDLFDFDDVEIAEFEL